VIIQITPPPTAPFEYIENPQLESNHILTDELRLTSTGSGAWQWTVGAFGQNNRSAIYSLGFFGSPGPLPTPFGSGSEIDSKNWAAFGDTSYKLGQLTLGAGVRYFEDHEEYTSFPPPLSQTGKFQSTDPRVYAQYALTQEASIYASAAKGFRSGGFNPVGTPTFGPEDVWSYELGTKTLLSEGRLSADGAVFYSNYKNYQIVGLVPPPALPLSIIRNAGDAWIKGIEWDLAFRPNDRWKLSFSGSVLDTIFYRINVIDSAYDVGDQLDFVPKYLFTGSLERAFIWDGRPGFMRLDYSEQGRETDRDRNVSGPTPWYFGESDVLHMLTFSTGVQFDRGTSVRLFAQNLLDDRGFDSPATQQNYAGRSRPRNYGIAFSMKFGHP
jgi:iron complex outermembrane receptor protein